MQSWGDLESGGAVAADAALPPTTEVGPDAAGVKTITFYRRNEKGEVEQVIRRVRVEARYSRVTKGILERRAGLTHFGKALADASPTKPSEEEIRIEQPGEAQEKDSGGLSALVAQGGVRVLMDEHREARRAWGVG